jgi:hypothetical protein
MPAGYTSKRATKGGIRSIPSGGPKENNREQDFTQSRTDVRWRSPARSTRSVAALTPGGRDRITAEGALAAVPGPYKIESAPLNSPGLPSIDRRTTPFPSKDTPLVSGAMALRDQQQSRGLPDDDCITRVCGDGNGRPARRDSCYR